MTSTQETETTIAEYIWVATSDAWTAGGTADLTDDEHRAACERAEAWLTDHEGDAISIRVRPPRRGEAGGTYRVTRNGDLQILGYSVPVPEEVRELIALACESALQTWPNA